jgi:hypothetical protein
MLKVRFVLNPEPDRDKFETVEEWQKAAQEIEKECIDGVAERFNLSSEKVLEIWKRVEGLDRGTTWTGKVPAPKQ